MPLKQDIPYFQTSSSVAMLRLTAGLWRNAPRVVPHGCSCLQALMAVRAFSREPADGTRGAGIFKIFMDKSMINPKLNAFNGNNRRDINHDQSSPNDKSSMISRGFSGKVQMDIYIYINRNTIASRSVSSVGWNSWNGGLVRRENQH